VYNFLGSFVTSDYIQLRDFATQELANIEFRLNNIAMERSRLESLKNKYYKLEEKYFKNSSDPKVDSFYKMTPVELADAIVVPPYIFDMEPAYYVGLLKDWLVPTIKTKRESPQYALLKIKDQMETLTKEQFTLKLRQADFTTLVDKISQLINTNKHLANTTTQTDSL
jgi:hypothetical protein